MWPGARSAPSEVREVGRVPPGLRALQARANQSCQVDSGETAWRVCKGVSSVGATWARGHAAAPP
eukprot:15196280-Alexandrium_andersonii.AAC.1